MRSASCCSSCFWSSSRSPTSDGSLAGRALRWESLLNARDLGGTPSSHVPIAHGAIVRSDALYRLNDRGRAALVAHGVRTVIDMRTPNEVAANGYVFDEQSGVVQHHIPQQTDAMWGPFAGKADRLTFDSAIATVPARRYADRDPAASARVAFDGMTAAQIVHNERERSTRR